MACHRRLGIRKLITLQLELGIVLSLCIADKRAGEAQVRWRFGADCIWQGKQRLHRDKMIGLTLVALNARA